MTASSRPRNYAEMLGLKFAYATNGHEIIEFDYFTGTETSRLPERRPNCGRDIATGTGIRKNAVADRA